MKKLSFIVIFCFISNQALAKTEGFYIGINAINTDSKFDHAIRLSKSKTNNNIAGVKNDNQASVGVNYKYALNFNGFFIAPNMFFDYSNLELKDKYSDKYKLDYRYGAKLDLGFDIGDRFAIFGSAGAVNSHNTVKYNTAVVGFGANGKGKADSHKISFLYGGGVKFSVLENVDLNLSYDISETEMKDPDRELTAFKIKTARAGASYRF